MNKERFDNLKDLIIKKQDELNKFLESENVNKSKALELSLELDKLIYEFYVYKNQAN
ncbi:Spo0E like sporulation regulatory protein [Proteiniborus ethanoligenes]|uniref:Spo0E like sporulation regulatory protein n=1 Tax=Proteiniborus ethanoligenes TaxID=415015 RepID=A0A1H3MQ84_9FIRM|nr:Spo0E family sporulation regulatory protein-aspartic acid phosphatase [Proteiniborus ethanoligenes]SDY78335.1 Spo0E like sporulation regulatory protein [Proteiniborus ethanoligenes]